MKTTDKIQEYLSYVGGRAVATGNVKSVTCPYDGSVVGNVHFAGPEHISGVVYHALKGFEQMKSLHTFQRARILEKIAAGLEKNHDEISRILALEAGKPVRFAKGEVTRCILTFKTAAEEAGRINGEIMNLDWAESAKGRMGFVRRFPIGPILGISPFNFPLNLAAHKIAPALAAGNSIIIKPASADPISALWLGRLAMEAGAPDGAVQVIPCSPDVLQPVIDDPRIKMISFTGSAEVGWGLKERSGKKRVALELGGNAGVIVDEDADLEYALRRILTGGFAYAGQVCISVQRVFIHEKIYDAFEKMLTDGVKNDVKLSEPLDPDAMLSAMIDEKEAVRVENWIKEAVDSGARLLIGGKRSGGRVEPTVLTDVARDMKVYKDEIFGPVIVLQKFSDFYDAIDMVNDSRYGLQAGVFTKGLEKAMKAFEEIEAGGVMINDVPTFRIDPMPYGGSKDSGFGREGLKYSIEEMTEMRLMVMNRPV